MANGDEAAIAALEAELGLGPVTEEGLALEEAEVAEDARTQAAIIQDRESRPGALEQFLYGEQGKEAARKRLDAVGAFKLGEQPLGPTIATTPGALPKKQTTEKSGSSVPGAVATGKPKPPPLTPPTPQTGGIDYQIGAIRRQQAALGDIAATEADIALGEGFYGLTDAEGNPVKESIATARLRKEMAHREKVANWEGEFKGEMKDFSLRSRYSGAPLASVKSWQAVLDEDVRDTTQWKRASLSEKLDIEKQDRMKKARAQSRLDNASRIDPSGPFKGIVSKMMATFAIALGAKSSSLSGGPNQALQMYQMLVSNDVDAQKTNWQKRKGEYAEKKNEYGEMMERFGSEHAADLALAVLQYDKGIELLKGQVLKQQNRVTTAQMDVTIGGLIATKDQLENALKKEFFLMKQRESSGLADLEGNEIRYIGARKGIEADPKDKEAIRDELTAATDIKQALDSYVEAAKDPEAWKWFGTAQAKAKGLREALIQMSSKFYGMGVLQEFEREVLNSVVPGGGTVTEKLITLFTSGDQSRLDAYAEGLTRFINDKFHSKIDRFTHYETTGRKRKRYASTGEKPESEKAQKLYKERTE